MFTLEVIGDITLGSNFLAQIIMPTKPKSPYPAILRYFLKKLLSEKIYGRYVGRHEHASFRIWKILASQLKPEDTILDIGAFHGEYVIAARSANLHSKIVAFEPNPLSARMLQDNCHGLGVHLEECAVTKESGQVTFSISSAMSHISKFDPAVEENCMRVQAINLDEWVAQKNLLISLIKIDVEGAEADVLYGGKKVLLEYQPILLCEVLSDDAGLAVMQALPAGYYYYHIDENHGLSMRSMIDRKRWRNKNWLFIPNNKTHLLANLL